MSPTTQVVIGAVGVIAQSVGTLLLTGLFLLLHRRATGRAYFQVWTWHWIWLATALGAVGLRYAVLPLVAVGTRADDAPGAMLCYATYQVAKLLALSALVSGAALAAERPWAGRARRVLPLVAALWAGLTLLDGAGLNALVVRQAPVAIAAYVAVALLLRRVPAGRSGLGARFLVGVALAHALVWVAYVPTFVDARDGGLPARIAGAVGFGTQTVRALIATGTFVDLLLDVLLAFGMVLVLTDDLWSTAERRARSLADAHGELERVMMRDPLTGALNRRAFEQGVGLEGARRGGHGAVLTVDLDDLKPVNDALGHDAGDTLLRAAAGVLAGVLREGQALYRWGGDEFVLVLPGDEPHLAVARVGDALELAPPAVPGVRLRASVGSAPFVAPLHGDDAAAAVRAAIAASDAAMYREKARRKTGRGMRAVAGG